MQRILFCAALALVAGCDGGETTMGHGGDGGSTSTTVSTTSGEGGEGGASTTSTSATAGAGGGTTDKWIGPASNCPYHPFSMMAPVDPIWPYYVGILDQDGVQVDETNGQALVLRCAKPPSYPWTVDEFAYELGRHVPSGCGLLDHDVFLFESDGLPTQIGFASSWTTPVLAADLVGEDVLGFLGEVASVSVHPNLTIQSGLVCAAVRLAVMPKLAVCPLRCEIETPEMPDMDLWTDTDMGLPACDSIGCDLESLDVSPTPEVSVQWDQAFGEMKFRFRGH